MPTVDESFLAYSRLVKPFPVRRLTDALYWVQADTASINQRLLRLQIDPPRQPDEWVAEVESLRLSLESLAGRCREAYPILGLMVDQAEGDYRRAVEGLVATIRGLQQQAEASAEHLAA